MIVPSLPWSAFTGGEIGFFAIHTNYLSIKISQTPSPTAIYSFKVNTGNTRTMCEICPRLTIKTPELVSTRIRTPLEKCLLSMQVSLPIVNESLPYSAIQSLPLYIKRFSTYHTPLGYKTKYPAQQLFPSIPFTKGFQFMDMLPMSQSCSRIFFLIIPRIFFFK